MAAAVPICCIAPITVTFGVTVMLVGPVYTPALMSIRASNMGRGVSRPYQSRFSLSGGSWSPGAPNFLVLGLSINRSSLKRGVRAGIAALKTRALQTLARPLSAGGVSRSVWSASDLSALSARDGCNRGSRSQCVRQSERELSMNLATISMAVEWGRSGGHPGGRRGRHPAARKERSRQPAPP